MNTPSNRRVILCLEPNLFGTAFNAWLTRTGADVISDPSGASALVAGPNDIVVSSRRYVSMATVVVIEEEGRDVSVYRNGTRDLYRYRGLDWLSALIEEQRGPPHRVGTQARRCG